MGIGFLCIAGIGFIFFQSGFLGGAHTQQAKLMDVK